MPYKGANGCSIRVDDFRSFRELEVKSRLRSRRVPGCPFRELRTIGDFKTDRSYEARRRFPDEPQPLPAWACQPEVGGWPLYFTPWPSIATALSSPQSETRGLR